MPRIIGGDALVVHTNTFRELDEFLMQEQEVSLWSRRVSQMPGADPAAVPMQ